MNHFASPNSLKKTLGGRNIYLVGMMGSGKSRTGPPLAKQLAYGFVDLDAIIETVVGKSIFKIFEDEGENYFREIEYKVLQEVGQRHSLVVATGGGVVISSQNWGILHQGIVIWLDPGCQRLLLRLQKDDLERRPLLQGNDPQGTLEALLAQREPLYSEADLHVAVTDETADAVSKMILSQLPSILKSPEDRGVPQTTED